MKKFLTIVACMFTASVYACLDYNNAGLKICPNDIVHSKDFTNTGAVVLGVNSAKRTIMVKANYNNRNYEYTVDNVAIEGACLKDVCANETIHSKDFTNTGARVLGINGFRNSVVVQAGYNGRVYEYPVGEIAVTNKCLRDICPNETVHSKDFTNTGALVLGVNPYKNAVVLKANYNNRVYEYFANTLAVERGCIRHVCVGNTVHSKDFTNTGALVLGVNRADRTAVVRVNYNNRVYSYSFSNLAARGCVHGICSGDVVYHSDFTNTGAEVLGANPETKEIVVKANYNNRVYSYFSDSLSVMTECMDYGYQERSQDFYF